MMKCQDHNIIMESKKTLFGFKKTRQVSDVINSKERDCSFIISSAKLYNKDERWRERRVKKFGSKYTHMIMNLNYNIIR